MSLIFDALRSKKIASQASKKSGLVWGDDNQSRKIPVASLRLIVSLALIIVIAGTLVLGVRYYLTSTMLKTAVLNPSSLVLPTDSSPDLAPDKAKSLRSMMDRMLENYQAGRYIDNNSILKEALINHTESLELNNLVGLNFLKQNRLVDAEIYFNKALQINDRCAECYSNIGYLLTLKSEAIKAESYLKKALSIKPELADAYFNLAVLHQKHGDIGQARIFFENYLKTSKNESNQIYIETKAYVQAMRDS